MEKKTLIIIILSMIAVIIISGVVFKTISHAGDNSSNNLDPSQVSPDSIETNNGDFTYIPPTLENNNTEIVPTPTLPAIEEEIEIPFVPDFKMDLDPTSISVFVNKEYALSKDYKPEDLVVPNIKFDLDYYDERTLMRVEAAVALEKLFSAAEMDGYTLCGVSAYRSYNRQYNIFTNNIVKQGKEHTLKYSAVPGTSEHQTGLSIDVSSESLDNKLSAALANMPEGSWLAENAHNYGFIIRYPKGKSSITGYAYEPWHIRYVGKGLANYLYTKDLTLDEYYNYKQSKDFNFEALYADLINYIPPNVTLVPNPDEVDIIGENGEIIEGGIDGIEVPGGEDGTATDGETTGDPISDDPNTDTNIPPKNGEITVTPTPEVTPGGTGNGEGEVSPGDGNTGGPSTQDPTGDGDTSGLTPTPTPTPIVTIAPSPEAAAGANN